MKLLVGIDGEVTRPDILSKNAIDVMTTPNKNGRSLIGWKGTDGRGTLWRTGTLTGTSALVVKQNNDIVWLMLTNTTTSRGSKIHRDVSKLMFSTVNKINTWPEHDLFEYFNPQFVYNNKD